LQGRSSSFLERSLGNTSYHKGKRNEKTTAGRKAWVMRATRKTWIRGLRRGRTTAVRSGGREKKAGNDAERHGAAAPFFHQGGGVEEGRRKEETVTETCEQAVREAKRAGQEPREKGREGRDYEFKRSEPPLNENERTEHRKERHRDKTSKTFVPTADPL